MSQNFKENVINTLAQHLGIPARGIMPTDDLYRDLGLTPLSLVVVLLDLERSVAVELPSHELSSVRTVAELVVKFRAWVQQSDARSVEAPRLRTRRSRAAQSERQRCRELHHLRWLERLSQTRRPTCTQQGDSNTARSRLSR